MADRIGWSGGIGSGSWTSRTAPATSPRPGAPAKSPVDKTAIQRQINATGRRIDDLVYELNGQTEEEIVKEANGE